MKRRSKELYYIHMLFFISLSAPITSTSPVLPVAFCTVGSCRISAYVNCLHVHKQLLTFTIIKTL